MSRPGAPVDDGGLAAGQALGQQRQHLVTEVAQGRTRPAAQGAAGIGIVTLLLLLLAVACALMQGDVGIRRRRAVEAAANSP
jgi:hypothetical protein